MIKNGRYLALSASVAISLALATYGLVSATIPATAVKPGSASAALPDLETAVPQHLQIQNSQQRELLRLSNGVANTGDGPLHMRPVIPLRSYVASGSYTGHL